MGVKPLSLLRRCLLLLLTFTLTGAPVLQPVSAFGAGSAVYAAQGLENGLDAEASEPADIEDIAETGIADGVSLDVPADPEVGEDPDAGISSPPGDADSAVSDTQETAESAVAGADPAETDAAADSAITLMETSAYDDDNSDDSAVISLTFGEEPITYYFDDVGEAFAAADNAEISGDVTLKVLKTTSSDISANGVYTVFSGAGGKVALDLNGQTLTLGAAEGASLTQITVAAQDFTILDGSQE